MNKPTVYLETSFINRLADPLKREPRLRQQQLSSREWWNTSRRRYTLISSPFTFNECCLEYPNQRIVRLRLRYFANLTIFRPPAKDLARLARALRQSRGPLPAEEVVDSQHIATAAIAGCRYLLTWNQKHLANPFIQKIIDNIIKSHGCQAPTIATPEQFLEAALD